MSLILVGNIHTVASSSSLCFSYTCTHHLLSLLHIACFLLLQPQAAMIRCIVGTPTTSVQPAPETATTFAFAGCPQVRLAWFTLQNQLIATFIRAYFHRWAPTAPSKCMLLLPQASSELRITRMKSRPATINSISKMLSQGMLLGGVSYLPYPG